MNLPPILPFYLTFRNEKNIKGKTSSWLILSLKPSIVESNQNWTKQTLKSSSLSLHLSLLETRLSSLETHLSPATTELPTTSPRPRVSMVHDHHNNRTHFLCATTTGPSKHISSASKPTALASSSRDHHRWPFSPIVLRSRGNHLHSSLCLHVATRSNHRDESP